MVADVVEAQRARVVDQHAEDAAPARQVADGAMGLLVDPAREEPRELAACLVEDAERDVARAREVGGGLQQPVEHRLEVELGQQAAPGVDEPREPVLVQAFERGHARGELTVGPARRDLRRTARGRRDHEHRARGLAQDLVVGADGDQHVDVSARLGHQRPAPRPATRVAAAAGASSCACASHSSARSSPAAISRTSAPTRSASVERQSDRVIGRAGRAARDGDARRDEGPHEAVAIRRHDDRARRRSPSSSPRPGSPEIRFWPTMIASGRSRCARATTASAKGRPESGR